MMAKTRAEQGAKEPFSYQAHFDEPLVIYDYVSGLPISEETAEKSPQLQQDETSVPAPLPSPSESELGDAEIVVEVLPRAGQEHSPTNPPTYHAGIIAVEVG